MKSTNPLWQQMQTLKDELALQSHLMSMDMRDQWHELEKQAQALEQRFEKAIESAAHDIGKAEEEFFVGEQQHVESMVNKFQTLKDEHEQK
ncbi:hypothetical protein [Aestuariibacter salexigens]|uniref:hypothetical protein n=1 Tax=Aestuariibacter salexigens TaxID=226010 RepID=UPI0004245747|nr:hypothetical protein [Aestuariibacter salexigens]